MPAILDFVKTKPSFFSAFFIGCGIAAASFLNLPAACLFLILFCACFYFVKREAPRSALAALSLVSLGAVLYFISDRVPDGDISRSIGAEKALLRGVIVTEIEDREGSYGQERRVFVLSARQLKKEGGKTEKVSGKIRAYLTDAGNSLAYGDDVLLKGSIAAPKGVRNPGGFDSGRFLEKQGIRALFYGEPGLDPKVFRHHRGNGFKEKAIQAKRYLSGILSRSFGDRDAGFLKSLFLGERSGLDDEFKDLFMRTGTMHILAVSGFNIGFLWAAIFFILMPLPVSINVKWTVALLLIWAYCGIVGWQAPVVRASLMGTVFIAGRLSGRRTDILNTLGLAALIILLVHPKELFDVGFQLSFLAVFGIAVFVPFFTKRPDLLPNEQWTLREKIFFYFRELFWVSFVCLVVTLPVTIQNFYIVTPLSLLANLIVVPVSFLLYLGGILFFLTFAWLPGFLSGIPFLMQSLLTVLITALEAIENIPYSYFIVGRLNPALWFLLSAGILSLLFRKRPRVPWKKALQVTLFVSAVLGLNEGLKYLPRGFEMTVLDVGQGDAIFIEFPDRTNLLVDAGKKIGDSGRFVIAPFLKSRGIRRIDSLLITHPHEDHIGGAFSLFDEFRISRVIRSKRYGRPLERELERLIEKERSENLFTGAGMAIEGYPAEILVLNPPPGKDNINEDSLVLRMAFGGQSFLLTGDIEEESMRRLLAHPGIAEVTVLKVPHHGGRVPEDAADFFKVTSPEISIISAGEGNRYGHPSPETLKALQSVEGNRIYRTDLNYAVTIRSDGKEIQVETLKPFPLAKKSV